MPSFLVVSPKFPFGSYSKSGIKKKFYLWIGTFYVSILDIIFTDLWTTFSSPTFLISFKLAEIKSLTLRNEVWSVSKENKFRLETSNTCSACPLTTTGQILYRIHLGELPTPRGL